jgi:RNA polymerase sigma-70 factor (ECF subfamily)
LDSYKELSDLDLARRGEQADEAAFAEIVRRFSPRVFSFASRFFRQRSLIEEAAQEVFLKAFLQLKNYEGRGSLEGWLTRITTTTCLNLLRNARHKLELTVSDLNETELNWLDSRAVFAAEEKQSTEEERAVAADLVNRVLDTLPPDDRLVLILMESEGASIKEVAELTGWSESKVKVQAFRARRRMRESVEKLLNKTQTTVSGKLRK